MDVAVTFTEVEGVDVIATRLCLRRPAKGVAKLVSTTDESLDQCAPVMAKSMDEVTFPKIEDMDVVAFTENGSVKVVTSTAAASVDELASAAVGGMEEAAFTRLPRATITVQMNSRCQQWHFC